MRRFGKYRWWAAGAAALGVAGLVATVSLVLVDGGETGSESKDEDSVESIAKANLGEEPGKGCEIVKIVAKEHLSNGDSGEVTGMSADGGYLVGNLDRPVLWHDGKTLPVGEKWDQQAVDVNSSGVVIGYDMSGGDTGPLWIWKDGERTELGLPELKEHEGVELLSVNDNGDILGNITFDDGMDEHDVRPLKWKVDSPGKSEELTYGGDTDAQGGAKVLRADGTVVGNTEQNMNDEGENRLWQWKKGDDTGEELSQPGTPAAEPGFDWAMGGDWVTTDEYRWNLDAPKEGEDTKVGAHAIDADGVVYGQLDSEKESERLPAFQEGTDVTELPTLGGDPALENTVTQVSEDGEVIAGQSTAEDGSIYPVTWRCAD